MGAYPGCEVCMITVLLVDDDPVIRQLLHDILDRYSDISIIGEAENGEDAIALSLRLKPSVVLMSLIRFRSVGTIRYSIIPASILERSRMVEINVIRRRLLSAMMRNVVRCSWDKGPGISSSSKWVPS